MSMRTGSGAVAALVRTSALWAQTPAAGQPARPVASQPTTQPVVWHLSDLIVKEVPPVPAYLSGEAQTTLKEVMAAIEKLFSPLAEKYRSGELRFQGPPIFTYSGLAPAPDRPFTLRVGFPVAVDTKAIEGYKVGALPAFRCGSYYFTGPVSELGAAYQRAYSDLIRVGHLPTGEAREVYLFWVGPDSPNNVIELQIGLAR